MDASYWFTDWSEDAIREARRLAQDALDRGEAEFLGVDRAELAAAIGDLDRLATRCEAGRYRGTVAWVSWVRVLPLIKAANMQLPIRRRRSPAT